MSHVGLIDQCRHCGHPRKRHRVRVSLLPGSACIGGVECGCTGFAPGSLRWDAVAAAGLWSVRSRATGKSFDGLPSRSAAEELATALTDVEDMLAAIYVADGRVSR